MSSKRPQEPIKPFPYVEKEVSFINSIDGTILKGTLTLPDEENKHPAVILVSGSGAQNRDEEILGHKPFLVIADHLTKAGIAVLRYDDRHYKMPAKKGWSYTTMDLAFDAKAALDFLHQQANIDTSFIGIAGHSEGGVIAPIVASTDSRVSFVISLAGTGVSGEIIAAKQNELFAENSTDLKFAKKVHSIIINESDFKSRKKKIWQVVNTTFGKFNIAAKYKQWLMINITASEWNRFFMMYDPAQAWGKVQCPVLALFGEFDIQVLPDANLAAVVNALTTANNPDYTTIIIPKANHLFQTVEAGEGKPYSELIKEYAMIEQTIDTEVLKIMTEWILKRYSAHGLNQRRS